MFPLIMSIVFMVLVQLGNSGLVYLSDGDKQSGVDVHNQYRIDAGATAMQKLKWNTALEQFAQRTASNCNFGHTSFSERQNIAGFPYIGENIYTVAGAAMSQPTLKEAIVDWASEKKDYSLDSNSCSSSMCLHYTQIVWSSTTDVGCAISKCDSGVSGFSSDPGYVVFCNYGIGGNMVGETPYERASGSSDVGSKCQEKFKENADGNGLCDPNAGTVSGDITTTTLDTDAWTTASFTTNCDWKCNWTCE